MPRECSQGERVNQVGNNGINTPFPTTPEVTHSTDTQREKEGNTKHVI